MKKVIGAIDHETRCKHYAGPLDIIAIKMKCCHDYYSCYYCHEEAASHEAEVWKQTELEQKAILCGSCKAELTIIQYLSSGSACPACHAGFNPKCANHYHFYFEAEGLLCKKD